MGNLITASGIGTSLKLSNGSTDVLFDVLTLSGCALAHTPWERQLVLYFADGHRASRGCSGFDLSELPWSDEWPSERAFFARMIDFARQRHSWQLLDYQPAAADAHLAQMHRMVADFVPTATPRGDWREAPDPALVVCCPTHGIYLGEWGCRLCDAQGVALS